MMIEPASRTIGPELFAWLLDEHSAGLELFARQFCDCPEDVVQEAMIALARQPSRPEHLLPWLYRTVRNGALDASRARRRRARHEQQVRQQSHPWFLPQGDDRLDAAAATQALSALSEECREVVVAHLWGGLSFAEIAGVIGASDSTAHRRYQDGLQQLRQQLGEACPTKNPRT
jgi:RNA polymerase sigma-70 factor (ECF subfamily)